MKWIRPSRNCQILWRDYKARKVIKKLANTSLYPHHHYWLAKFPRPRSSTPMTLTGGSAHPTRIWIKVCWVDSSQLWKQMTLLIRSWWTSSIRWSKRLMDWSTSRRHKDRLWFSIRRKPSMCSRESSHWAYYPCTKTISCRDKLSLVMIAD